MIDAVTVTDAIDQKDRSNDITQCCMAIKNTKAIEIRTLQSLVLRRHFLSKCLWKAKRVHKRSHVKCVMSINFCLCFYIFWLDFETVWQMFYFVIFIQSVLLRNRQYFFFNHYSNDSDCEIVEVKRPKHNLIGSQLDYSCKYTFLIITVQSET